MALVQPIVGCIIHQSIKESLSPSKYHMVEKGLLKISGKAFNQREDKYGYKKVVSKLHSEELIYFFLANSVVGNNYPFCDYEKSMKIYVDFCKMKSSISYFFEQDILKLDSEADLFDINDDYQPGIVRYVLSGKISLESFILLQMEIFDVFSLNFYDYIWNERKIFINNYMKFFEGGFIKYDSEKIKRIYKKTLI